MVHFLNNTYTTGIPYLIEYNIWAKEIRFLEFWWLTQTTYYGEHTED